MSNEIGELSEEPGEVRGQWRIPDFLSLPKEVDTSYQSPKFLFFDSCWRLSIYPYGRSTESDEWIALYLMKVNMESSRKVNASFGVRNTEGELERSTSTDIIFTASERSWGWPQFLKISELQDRKAKLAPSGTLTIAIKIKGRHSSEGSLFRRLWNVSCAMKEILSSAERTDVTLNLKDGEIPAHRMILESRSAVFKRMFGVDMLESGTGEVDIEDATVGAFRVALYYAYSGEPKGLKRENVIEVYRVAHKYEFEELRKLCTLFMRDTLSPNTVCDVIALANLYQEMTLKESAKVYFIKNKTEVFKTERWKTFKRDYPIIACELLEIMLGSGV